ncbi:G1 family glutamic endopeptidase [Paenibacillus sp. FSL W8-1287]|uniref:G1 family glutamic endopeptidase n=1 Tax=Paenibacillus sp. FSL W8-1287 TaxID=2954653 RepID=UPI0030CF279A
MGILKVDKWNHTCKLETSAKPHRNIGWVSSNWSGYSITGKKGTFKRVSAKWNVPFLRPSQGASYSSAWIGIDGYGNNSLIQTGTGHDFIDGKAYYYAWWGDSTGLGYAHSIACPARGPHACHHHQAQRIYLADLPSQLNPQLDLSNVAALHRSADFCRMDR